VKEGLAIIPIETIKEAMKYVFSSKKIIPKKDWNSEKNLKTLKIQKENRRKKRKQEKELDLDSVFCILHKYFLF